MLFVQISTTTSGLQQLSGQNPVKNVSSKKIKFSLYSRYYPEACNERQGPSPRVSAWVLSSEETSQRRRAVGDTVSDLTDPGFKPQITRTDNNVLATELTGPPVLSIQKKKIRVTKKLSNHHICLHA